MKHSQEILLKAMKAEKASLNNTLSSFSKEFKKESAPVIPTRKESDGQYAAESQEISKTYKKKSKDMLYTLVQTTTTVRRIHEASRAQRDAEIIGAGHKKLMFSCIQAAQARNEKLARSIKAIEDTPQ